MRHLFASVLAGLYMIAAADAQTLESWTVDTDKAVPKPLVIRRGETRDLRVTFKSYSQAAAIPTNASVYLWYRSADMSNGLYYALTGSVHNATAGVARVLWTAGACAAATNYTWDLVVLSNSAPMNLRAFGTIQLQAGVYSQATTQTNPATYLALDWARIVNLNTNSAPFETDAEIMRALRHVYYGTPDIAENAASDFTVVAGAVTAYSGGPNCVIPWEIRGTAITAVASYALNNAGITNLALPNTVTSLGDWACANNWSLSNVRFSDALVSIGANAFYDDNALAAVSIPATVSSIGASAFLECDALSRVYFSGNAPASGGSTLQNTLATVYVTNPTATGWRTSFDSHAVVRSPIGADNVITNGGATVDGQAISNGAVIVTVGVSGAIVTNIVGGIMATGTAYRATTAVATNDARYLAALTNAAAFATAAQGVSGTNAQARVAVLETNTVSPSATNELWQATTNLMTLATNTLWIADTNADNIATNVLGQSLTNAIRGATNSLWQATTNQINASTNTLGVSLTNQLNVATNTLGNSLTNVIRNATNTLWIAMTNQLTIGTNTLGQSLTNTITIATNRLGQDLTNTINVATNTLWGNVGSAITTATNTLDQSLTNSINIATNALGTSLTNIIRGATNTLWQAATNSDTIATNTLWIATTNALGSYVTGAVYVAGTTPTVVSNVMRIGTNSFGGGSSPATDLAPLTARVDAHSLSIAELGFMQSALSTWTARPFSQFLADYFMDQTWFSVGSSTNITYNTASDRYQFADGIDKCIALNESGGDTDYLTNGVGAANWNTADWTISLWFKKTTLNEQEYVYTMLNSAGSAWLHNISVTATGILRTEGGATSYDTAAGTIVTGRWYHLVDTYSNATGKANVWLNGVRVVTNLTRTLGAVGTRHPFALGTQANGLGSSYSWSGYMNEFSVHQYAFTEADVAAVYNSSNGIFMATNYLSCKQLLHFESTIADSHPANNTPTAAGTIDYGTAFITLTNAYAFGALQSLPWFSATTQNAATVEFLASKSTIPSTNFSFYLSNDSGSTFSNISITALGSWMGDTNYFRWKGTARWATGGSGHVYRAVWSNNESLYLKGVSHFVENAN